MMIKKFLYACLLLTSAHIMGEKELSVKEIKESRWQPTGYDLHVVYHQGRNLEEKIKASADAQLQTYQKTCQRERNSLLREIEERREHVFLDEYYNAYKEYAQCLKNNMMMH